MKMKRYKQNEIAALAEILRNDGVISVPTDTVFGVCARMDSSLAQENLRHVKHRPFTKAFPIMCADLEQMKTIAMVDKRAEKIIRALMPGPLTIVLQKQKTVAKDVNGGMDTLALRMAAAGPLRDLILAVGVPLFMTSANMSDQPVCTSLDEIEKACPNLSAMMEGTAHLGEASTILDASKKELSILRYGPITLEEIKAVLLAEDA